MPGTNGRNGRNLLTVDARAPPPTTTATAEGDASKDEDVAMKTVYNFEFEVKGEITVGEFEVSFWAEYADGRGFQSSPLFSSNQAVFVLLLKPLT